MDNPSSTVWTEVSTRADIERIIWELVGLTAIRLCTVAETSRGALGQTIRQSTFRLKIIFDTQSLHFVKRQFSKAKGEDFGLLSKNSCFEVAVYLTSLGTRLEAPDRCGRQDYALQRALALDAFISAFRLLILHGEPLRFEQEDLLRDRVGQLIQAWTQQQPLSALEDLVLNTVVPVTLDEVQETDGNSCIQHLGCGKFSVSSFERGRTPFCSDPASPPLRSLSLKSASQCVRTTLDGMTDVNLLEAFWTLHDVASAALVTVIQSPISSSSESSDKDILNTIQIISSSLAEATAQKKAAWEYIGGIWSQLPSNSGMQIPTRGAASDRLKRSLNAEASEFASFLGARDAAPSQPEPQKSELADTTSSGKDQHTREAADLDLSGAHDKILEDSNQQEDPVSPVVVQQTRDDTAVGYHDQLQYPPPLQIRRPESRLSPPPQESPVSPQAVVVGYHTASPSFSEASTSKEVQGPPPPPQFQRPEERPTPQESPLSPQALLAQSTTASPSISEASASIGTRSPLPAFSYQDNVQRGPTPVFGVNVPPQHLPGYGGQGVASPITEVVWVSARSSPASPYGEILQRTTTPLHGSVELMNTTPDAQHAQYLPYQPIPIPVASPQPPPESQLPELYSPTVQPTGIPSYIDSGLQVVESGQPVYKPSPPPPDEHPIIRPDSGVLPEAHRFVRPSSPAPSSATGTSSRTSLKKKFNVFGMFGGAPKRGSTSEPVGPSVPEDLQFRFSAAGMTLLLWPRRSPSHITKLPWPFRGGSLLHLSQPQSDQHTIRQGAGGVTVRLVEGGTNSVAVVILVDKTCKLLYFDQHDHKSETDLGLVTTSSAAATCLAVSRDDAMIAVGCGPVIHLFRVINGMPYLTNSVEPHSQCAAFESGQYRIQRLNFSPDSTVMVAATQEYNRSHKYPVYLRLWDCSGMDANQLDPELEPSMLSLGYGDDTGLTSIFCAMDSTRPENSRLFLTAGCNKSYSAILSPVKRGRHKHLDLAEKRIDNAAQVDDVFAFKSGRHKLYLLDVVSGTTREIANFSAERADLKVQQDAIAIGMPSRGRVFAFWKSNSGALVLKQVEVPEGEGSPTLYTMDLRDIYLRLNSTATM